MNSQKNADTQNPQSFAEKWERKTTLEDVSAVIGFTATLRLAAWYGDLKNLYVPKKAEPDCRLARVIGADNARRMSAEWGGDWLPIPQIQVYDVEVRRRSIARMAQQGFRPQEIAVFLRMSERRVQQLCRELEAQGLLQIIVPKRSMTGQGGTTDGALGKNGGKNAGRKTGGRGVQPGPEIDPDAVAHTESVMRAAFRRVG